MKEIDDGPSHPLDTFREYSSLRVGIEPRADRSRRGTRALPMYAAQSAPRLISVLEAGRARAMRDRSRSLDIVLCYEVGYDGFWLARLLIARGIRTIVFDPASFLKPRIVQTDPGATSLTGFDVI